MLETLTTTRPLFAPDPKITAPGTESAGLPAAAPTAEAPLPAPSELLKLTLETPPPPADPVAEVVDLSYRPSSDAPPGVNAMSLFRGMLTEASRSGANVPGTSMHIYALVQQLSSLVESNVEIAA